MLHADRARTNEFQGVDIEVLEVAARVRRRGSGPDALMGEQLGGDVLGVRFQCRGAIGSQWHLTGEEFVNAPAQYRPIALRDVEVSSQIEQGALSHIRAGAFAAHEAQGEIVVADAAGTGAADEHGDTIAGAGIGCNRYNTFYGTTFASPTTHQSLTSENRPHRARFPPNRSSWW